MPWAGVTAFYIFPAAHCRGGSLQVLAHPVPRPSPSTLAIPEGSSGQGATPLGHTDSWEWGDKWGTQRGEQAGWHPGLMWRAPRTGRRGGLSGPLQVSPVRQAHGRVPAPPLT